ncbi:MAG: hypothetical protein Q7V19_17490 [Bacteroidales bacterium]|nr:hypothetical protein [Bacteroidales bacterium]
MLLLLFLLPYFSNAQISGCTDPQSVNFNPQAAQNDGSCLYPVTVYNPPFAFELPVAVRETSGLFLLNSRLWTFNDSGGSAALFAIDTATAQVVQQISISNASNIDWEDITMDDAYIYIGDFGNNAGVRKDLTIYKVAKEDIPLTGNTSVIAEKLSFSYPDQQSFERSKSHNFDCEAMIAAGNNLFLFSKNRGDSKTKLYSLPKSPGTHIADLIETFDTKGLITGADYNEDLNEIILTGYTNNTYLPFLWLLFDFDDHDFFSGNKRRIDLVNLITTQVEGITYVNGRNAYISSERSQTYSARVFKISSAQRTDHLSNIGEQNESQARKLILADNPVQNNLLRVKHSKSMKEIVRLDISDTSGKVIYTEALPFRKSEGSEYIEIDTSNLKAGVYHVTLFTKRRHFSTTFIQP